MGKYKEISPGIQEYSPHAGESIQNAAKEITNHLFYSPDFEVHMKFNDVDLVAKVSSKPDDIVRAYYAELVSEFPYQSDADWSPKYAALKYIHFIPSTIDVAELERLLNVIIDLLKSIKTQNEDELLSYEAIPTKPRKIIKMRARLKEIQYVKASMPLDDELDIDLSDE